MIQKLEHFNGIFILGAGGLGREIAAWNTLTNNPIPILGFIDDNAQNLNHEIRVGKHNYPIISLSTAISDFKNHKFIPAISNPHLKQELIEQLSNGGLVLSRYIHDTSFIAPDVVISEGVIICPQVSISTNVIIGKSVLLNVGTRIGHDCKIGDFTSVLGGNLINGDVTIGNKCLIGAGAVIRPGKIIENSSVVGIGSVVIRNVKEGTTVFGNPAQLISKGH